MKILVIQNRMGIGDTVIFLPYIKALSKKFNSPISLLVKESSKADQYLHQTDYIDKILLLERNKKTILACFAMEKNLSEWKKLIESTNHENISSKKKSIYNFFIENNLKEESDKLLADYISQCNDIINELPDEIQGGLNELISYIIKRNK